MFPTGIINASDTDWDINYSIKIIIYTTKYFWNTVCTRKSAHFIVSYLPNGH